MCMVDHGLRIKNVFDDDLPPDLARLHTLRTWHELWLMRIDRKITALQQRRAEEERGRRARPRPPEWVVELGIGTGRPPLRVHTGDCHMTGSRCRPIGRDEARRLLAGGLAACTHCQPDSRLHILDLPVPRDAATPPRTPVPQAIPCDLGRHLHRCPKGPPP
jgi:hypothetical protein